MLSYYLFRTIGVVPTLWSEPRRVRTGTRRRESLAIILRDVIVRLEPSVSDGLVETNVFCIRERVVVEHHNTHSIYKKHQTVEQGVCVAIAEVVGDRPSFVRDVVVAQIVQRI